MRNDSDLKKGKRTNKFVFKSSIYDYSDLVAASEHAYDPEMDDDELRSKRRRDWLMLIIGIPAFIGIIYFIVWLSQR